MDLSLLWIFGAAFIGAVLGVLINWLSADGMTAKQLVQGIVTGVISAAVFAGAYQIKFVSLTLYDIFAAIIGGAGTVLAGAHITRALNLKRSNKDFFRLS
jgi:hypothetical protein